MPLPSSAAVCNWDRSSSAVSLCAVPPSSLTFHLLFHCCQFALPAGVRQLFLLRQNVGAAVSCASQRAGVAYLLPAVREAADFRLALYMPGPSLLFLWRSPRLPVIALGHSRALWYPSHHRDCGALFFPWVSCVSSCPVTKTFLLFLQNNVLVLVTSWWWFQPQFHWLEHFNKAVVMSSMNISVAILFLRWE